MKKTLNLGCGERTYSEYPDKGYTCFNYDEREDLPNVDVIGDVTDLSRYSDEEFSYILASDILEHFPFKYTEAILKEWQRVLSVDGTLELRVPNFEFMLKHYKEHVNMQHISWLIMGGQDYFLNQHYIVFNEKWLREICENVGFVFTSCVEESSNIIMLVKKI